jgi:hypothetical protein
VPNVTVDVNNAERDAIEQVLQRHGSIFDNYERDLLSPGENRGIRADEPTANAIKAVGWSSFDYIDPTSVGVSSSFNEATGRERR